MMHHDTKFGNKMFNSLEDIIWINTDILTLCCDPDLENSKPNFPHDILAHDDASQYQVWFKKKMFAGLGDIIWAHINILTFSVTLTLIAVIQYFTEHSGL